jgi:hypothetical protein
MFAVPPAAAGENNKPKQGECKMNTSETRIVHGASLESILSGIAGGSITESVGAMSAMVLAIIGLAGIFPDALAAIATIVIGAVILMDGGLVGLVGQRLHSQEENERHTEELGGVTAGFFGGLAGIVLGILGLFQTMSDTLLAVAVLVYGATLLLEISHLNWQLQFQSQARSQDAPRIAAATGSGGLLVGLAAVVLGILAIVGLAPATLILAGLLSLGACALFSGPAITNWTRQ